MASEDRQANNARRPPAPLLLPEILVIIFSFHAKANPTNSASEIGSGEMGRKKTLAQHRLGWITVTHVCSLWRQVALDIRALWAHLQFNLGLEWTAEMLSRAGDAPLNVTLCEEVVSLPPFKEHVTDIIVHLLHRVSTLTIEGYACTLDVLDSLIVPAPLMSSLTISSNSFAVLPRSLFAGVAPRLHHLFLYNALPTWTTVVFTYLKRLVILIDSQVDISNIPSYTDLFNALQNMPDLETLILTGCLPLGPFPCYLEDQKVQLSKLQYLSLNGHVQGFRQILKHLDFPPKALREGTCVTDDMTGQDCCNVLPLLLSYLPRPSLETLDVSWRSQFDRTFRISGYSTSHEEADSGKPCFSLGDSQCFGIEFQFKFLLWSAEQKLRILKAVCGALPTAQLRILSGTLGLGEEAWPEIFGAYQELRHIRICSSSTFFSIIPFLGREGVYPKLVSLTLRHINLNSDQCGAVVLVDKLKTGKLPMLSKVFIEGCVIRRDLVVSMRATLPDIEIRWDGIEVSREAIVIPKSYGFNNTS